MAHALEMKIANIKRIAAEQLQYIADTIAEYGGDALVFQGFVIDACTDGIDEAFADVGSEDAVWPVKATSTLVYNTSRGA